MTRLIALLCLLLAAATGPAAAQPSFPERGTAPVVDGANIIEPSAEAQLSTTLDAFEERNQRQFVVATVPSLDGYDIADYGYQLGRHWRLGDEENDDGILLLVAPNERKVRIEVGYGLESILPDGLAYDIVEGEILPRFKAGDMTGGILAGAGAVIRQLELPPEEARAIAAQAAAPQRNGEGFPIGALAWPVFLIFFFVILPMFGRLRGGKRYRGSGVASGVGQVIMWSALNAAMNSGRGSGGGFGGGGFGGGGGFSGGGGSFGGGGASGSW